MRIGIILHPYGEDKPAGLGRAIFEITRSILDLEARLPSGSRASRNEYLIILRRKPKTLPEFPGNNWRIKIADHKYLWLDRALFGENLDICIFNTPIISFFVRPRKSVVIAYDFAYDNFRPNYLLKFYHRFSLKAADLIISVSNATKNEIIELFNITAEKIKIVYLGYTNICGNAPLALGRVPEKYFLSIGAIKMRKNVLGIVKSFALAKKESRMAHKLIICGTGKGEYFDSVLNFIKGNGLTDQIIFFEHPTDSELSYLYKNATALLYLSFIEGFGLPILEAMACGLPVVASNASGLPEAAGEAAILVNPRNIEEIKKAIINLSSNADLRLELIDKGIKRAKIFSWEKTGKDILALL